jgi:hypothetical protein
MFPGLIFCRKKKFRADQIFGEGNASKTGLPESQEFLLG